ncbi:hypothetical protein F4859DRAFT_512304 [Xylaria cf. heliscus]|nr:hypothetical protein F4859DRAFT_512304 [Xylaria cf. heliscus]
MALYQRLSPAQGRTGDGDSPPERSAVKQPRIKYRLLGADETHFPESWAPQKFDIWGASHQIFHLFVVLSAAIHVWGILTVYDWVYNNPQCPG